MKDVFKKVSLLMVTVLMLFSMVGKNVYADETITINGDATITIYDGQVFLEKHEGSDARETHLDGAVINVYEGEFPNFEKPSAGAVDTWTTDSTNHPFSNLVEGKKYTLVETDPPKDYVRAKNVVFTATNGKQEFVMNDYKVWALKTDTETYETKFVGRSQGDAKLYDGTFHVEDAAGNKVGESYTLKDSEFTYLQGLNEGETYYLVEDKAPTGYRHETAKLQFTADLANNGEETAKFKVAPGETEENLTKDLIFKNEVKTFYFSVLKQFNRKTGLSSFTEYEEGAEFTLVPENFIKAIVAAGLVEEDALDLVKVQKAMELKEDGDPAIAELEDEMLSRFANGLTDNEWDVITTGADGKAQSKQLAYGKYWVQQTAKTQPEAKLIKDHKLIDGTSVQDKAEIHASSVNEEARYFLKLIKVDAETNKPITTEATAFTITNKETGEQLTMKIGTDFGVFVTNGEKQVEKESDYWVNENDEAGSVVTPSVVPHGVYTLNEVWTPAGFTNLGEEGYEIYVNEDGLVVLDANDNSTAIFNIPNPRAYGELTINKEVEKWEADKSFIDHTDYSGIKFEIRAAEDIISPIDGSVITKAGEVWGEYNLNADGTLVVEKIDLGKYTVKEIEAPKGIIMDETVYNVEFIQPEDDRTTLVFKQEINPTNKVTKTEITKVDATTGTGLEGAVLKVVDKNNALIDTWTSTKEPHTIEGLTAGETYTLVEESAPIGYTIASSVDFKVNEDGSVTKVEMVDTVVKVAKVDQDGKLLSGVRLGVYDTNGNSIETWTTGEHKVDLTEEDVAALDKGETLEKENMVIVPIMAKEEGILGLFGFKYARGAMVTEYVDGKATNIYEVDTEGNETYHIVKGLEQNKDYGLAEVPPLLKGYYAAKDIKFQTSPTENVVLEMVDNKINYSVVKVDDSGEKLENAKIELHEYNDETKQYNKVHEWTTVLEKEDISDYLVAGRIYKVVESAAPAGHYKAVEQTFQVPKYGTSDEITITMVDVAGVVNFAKFDPVTGKHVMGARYAIFKLNEGTTTAMLKGKTVSELEKNELITVITYLDTINGYQDKDIKGKEIAKMLHENETYYLQEFKAPFGYEIDPEAHEFKMTGNKDTKQVLRVTDDPKLLYVQVAKADAKNVKYMLANAEITVYKEDGTVAKTRDGKPAVGLTNKNGVVTFSIEFDQSQGYYAKETKAPSGYQLNKDKFEVKVSENYTFFETDLIKISVLDQALIIPPVKELIKTGGGLAAVIAVPTLLIAGVAVVLLNRKKKNTQA